MRDIGRGAFVLTVFVAGGFVLAQAAPGNRVTTAVANVAERVTGAVMDRVSDHGHEQDGDARFTQDGQEFAWSAHLDASDVIEIKGVNGAVFAEYTSGDEVEVRAVKKARKSDPESVSVEVVEHAEGYTVCAVYPSRDSRENYCAPGDEGRNNVRNNDVQVTFYVSVPRDVVLRANTVNGQVKIEDLQSDVFAETVNGSIHVTTTGFAHAETVNGSIDAVMGTIDSDGMEFSTVNGSIKLDLPDRLDADLDASWVNGSLTNDLPMELVGRVSKRSAEGRFGQGGPEIELETVNGSIRIR